jgi:pyrimidine-nucleoside phosphorylase
MQSIEEARKLARMMVSIGELAGRRVVALISDMNQPLGFAVGNSLEVCEAIDVLNGGGPDDLHQHCLVLSSHMLLLGKIAPDMKTAMSLSKDAIISGAAMEKFKALVTAQGGDKTFVEDPSRFPRANCIEDVKFSLSGYIAQIHARLIGEASVLLGAGRARKEDEVDHSVGIVVHHKVGDFVDKSDVIYTLHAGNQTQLDDAKKYLQDAFIIQNERTLPLPLFYE